MKSAALQLRKDIDPSLTIEVSATPILEGDYDVKILTDDVKREAMIKKVVSFERKFCECFQRRKNQNGIRRKKV